MVKFKQSNNNYDSFLLYSSDANCNINYNYYKKTQVKNENGLYRYVDLSSFVISDMKKKYYFVIVPDYNVTSELKIFTTLSSYKPNIICEEHIDYDHYKKQNFINGVFGDDNCYSINIRNGKFKYKSQLIKTIGNKASVNLELIYDISKYNKFLYGLPNGFKFNYQQRVYVENQKEIYIDGENKKHTFDIPDNGTELGYTYEVDGNYLTLNEYLGGWSIYTIDGSELVFDEEGYLIKILSKYHSNDSPDIITIDYELISDRNYNYDKLDKITDSNGNVIKFKYLTLLSGKSYIFLFVNNNENFDNYDLTDYIDKSVAYIKYKDDKIELIVDKHSKETTFNYTQFTDFNNGQPCNYPIINSIKRQNKKIQLAFNEDKKVKWLEEYDIYDGEENGIYDTYTKLFNKILFNYSSHITNVRQIPYGIFERSREYEYYFNDLCECEYTYEKIINKIANLKYNRIFSNKEYSFNDYKNIAITNEGFELENINSGEFSYYETTPSPMYNIILIIKAHNTNELDCTCNNTININIKLGGIIKYTEEFKLLNDNYTVIFIPYYQGMNQNMENINVLWSSNIYLDIKYSNILISGGEIVNKKILHENKVYNINDSINPNDVTYELNNVRPGFVDNTIKSFSVEDYYANLYGANDVQYTSINLWYNNGTKMIANVSRIYLYDELISNYALIEEKNNNIIELEKMSHPLGGFIYFTYNEKQIWYNQTASTYYHYDIKNGIVRIENCDGEIINFEYDTYGNKINQVGNKYIINDQFIRQQVYKTYFKREFNNEHGIIDYSILDETKCARSTYDCVKGIISNTNLDNIIKINIDYYKNKPSKIYGNLNNQEYKNIVDYELDGYVSSYTDNGITYTFVYGIFHQLLEVLMDDVVIIKNDYKYQYEENGITKNDKTIITTVYQQILDDELDEDLLSEKYEYVYNKYDMLVEINKYENVNSTIKKNLITYYYDDNCATFNSEGRLNRNNPFIHEHTPTSKLNHILELIETDNSQIYSSYEYDKHGNIDEKYCTQNNYNYKVEYENGLYSNKTMGISPLSFYQKTIYSDPYLNPTVEYSEASYDKLVNITDYVNNQTIEYENVLKTCRYYSMSNKIIENNQQNKIDLIYKKTKNSYCGKEDTYMSIQDDVNEVWTIKKDLIYKSGINGTNTPFPMKEKFTYEKPFKESPVTDSFEYEYDSNERLKKEISKNEDMLLNEIYYKYDLFDRLIREDNRRLDYTYTYEYDLYGNIIRKNIYQYTTENNLTNKISEKNYIYHLRYDNQNLNKNNHMLKQYDNRNMIYDKRNRLIADGEKNFEWNNNQLVKCVKNGVEVNFSYNFLGMRTEKKITTGSNVTSRKYILDDNKIFQEILPNGEVIKYIYDDDLIIGFEFSNNYYIYYRNSFGLISGILYNNMMIARYVYDAWGNHRVYDMYHRENNDPNFLGNINPIRYKGYYYDVETQLYWVSSRYYSPELCRWLSPDSIDYLDPSSINGLNLYCYCFNNPVNYYDPTGHSAIALLIAFGIGAVLGGIYGGVSAAANGQNVWAGIGIGAVVGGLTGLITEVASIPLMLLGTFAVGAGGDIASQMILEGKSFGEVNLISAAWAGVANAGLALVGKGLSIVDKMAGLTNAESIIFGTMTNSPLLGLGMAINMGISKHSNVYTVNDLYDDTFGRIKQLIWRW